MSQSSGDQADHDKIRTSRRTMRGAVGTPGGADIPSVFAECFRFLKALSRGYIIVQRRWVWSVGVVYILLYYQ